jgi:lipoprotein-releasing system permease protein
LSFEYFISKRILKNEVEGNKVSRPIVRISIISIALAVVVNLITLAVVTGFQHEVRQKVSGFGSHAFVMNASEGSIYECEPILKNQAFFLNFKKNNEISHIQYVAFKPVLFQSDKKTISYKLSNGKDTTETQQEIQGAIIKGVDEGFDWSFFKEHLVKGKIPHFNNSKLSNELLISSTIAKDLNIEVGDEIKAFFVKTQPVKRLFKIVGIYETGLEEFDKKIVIGDIKNVQKLNDWGVQASIVVSDTLSNGNLIIKGNIIGGNGNYRYDWGNGFETYEGFTICPIRDTIIRLIASDYWSNIDGKNEKTSIADTAYLSIKIKGTAYSYCDIKQNSEGENIRTYQNKTGTKFSLECSSKTLYFEQKDGKGSFQNYVSGFEVMVSNWDQLPEIINRLKRKIEFIPTENNEQLKVTSIMENEADIFIWLGFLDLNVYIILILMILIGIINMGSALLVLILVRSNFIGLLKAMGANNWSIRKIFLYQGAFLIGKGMIWGNIIGLTFCFLQSQFGILSLNPEVYYLTKVPIELNFWHWLFLNIGTLVTCIVALIIPSYVITRVNPVKAIKFN